MENADVGLAETFAGADGSSTSDCVVISRAELDWPGISERAPVVPPCLTFIASVFSPLLTTERGLEGGGGGSLCFKCGLRDEKLCSTQHRERGRHKALSI